MKARYLEEPRLIEVGYSDPLISCVGADTGIDDQKGVQGQIGKRQSLRSFQAQPDVGPGRRSFGVASGKPQVSLR